MLKFLRTFALAAAMMLPFAMQAQQSWTVADGTTTHALVPLDFYNCDGSGNRQAQMLYPASLLTEMDGATIGTVKLYHQNTSSKTVTASTWYLRMGETSEADLSSGFSSETLTTVYSGNLVITGGVMTFELTTPYTYNGGNLIVEIQTSGATGNWFGSSSQGCYGVDNAGSTYSTMSSPNYTAFVPKATFTEVPSCFPVTGLAIDATQTTSSSLTLTWTDANNSGAGYDVYLVTPTDTTLLDNTTTTTYTATGLDANTAYVFGVVSNCGGDMAQMATVSGRTACGAAVTGTTWNFEDMSTSAAPMCFTHLGNGSSNVTTGTSNTNYHSATKYIQFSGATGNNILILPETEDDINTLQLKFWTRPESSSSSCGSFSVGYITDITDASTFTALTTYSYSDFGSTVAYTEKTVMFDAAPAGSRMAFCHNSGASYYYWHLDDVTIEELPSCIPVSRLAIDANETTSNSITLTWMSDATDFVIYNMADGSTLGTSNTNSFTATGLDANTNYTFGVAVACGSEESDTVTVNGRTACAAIATLPYTMGFEDADLQGTTSALLFPFCWTRINTLASGTYTYYPYAYNYGTPHDGGRHLYFYASSSYGTYADTTGFVMPALDVETYPMNSNRVVFWAKVSSSSSPYTVQVGTMTDPSDRSTFTLAESVSVTATSYTKYTVSLASAAATDAYVAFIVPKVTSSMYIDDVTLEELPSCGDVTGLTVAGTTSSTATLRWNTVAGAMGYTVYNMADSSVLGTATDTTYTVEDLDANTVYTFGVQSNCAGGDGVMATASGRTACAAETMPWSENFDNWTEKSPCWSFLSGLLSQGNPTASTSAWTLTSSYGDYITLSGKALGMNLYNQNRYWAVTPAISITSDNAVLSVDVAVALWSGATPNYDDNDTLAFLATTDGGATWTVLQTYNGTQLNAFGNEYTTLIVPIPSDYYGMDVRFAIYGGSVSGTNPHDNRFVFDNVSVDEAPDCLPVAGLAVSNVAGHTATLTWSGTAGGYTIWDMSDTTVYEYANDTTVDLYALDPVTAYTFGVTANCGSDESDMRTVSFTTAISCPAPTNLAAALTPGNGTVATLSWHEAGEAAEWQICIDGDMENLIDVTDTAYDMTGLTAEQAVTAKVRAICGADDTSAWSSTITFTPTDAFSVTVNDGTTTNDHVPIYGLYVDNNIHSQFIIPAADLSAMAYGIVNKLTFYASKANVNWGSASFKVYLTETDATTVNSLNSVADMEQVYTGSLSISGNQMVVTFTTPYQYMGGNLLVAFEQPTSGSWSSCSWYGVNATGASMGGYGTSVSQRNFLPKMTIDYTPGEEPSCLPVSGLAASDISTDEATLSWTGDAGSYNVYSISGADTTFVQNVSDTTVTLTGLDAMTQYTYGVRAACGSDESDIRTVVFNTACDAVSLPYTETFAATSATRNCWNLVSNNTANVGGDNGMGFVTVSGRDVMRFSSYTSASDYNQYGFSPLMNVSTDATNLQVKVVYGTYGTSDQLFFGYITATDTVWDPTPYSTEGGYSASDWQSQTFVIPATATQLAVHYYGDYKYYAWVDSVVVTELTGDYCYPVSALTVDSATTTSISLSWTSDATSFTVLDMSDSSVIAANVTTTSYEVTGLTAMTAYTFGVVVNCATGNSDTMTITATTACADVTTLPYYEGFDNANLGCWTTVNGSTDGENWFAFNPSQMSGGITAHNGAYVASSWSWNSSAMNANAWLISPKFVLPTINAGDSLTFSWWELTASGYPDSYSVAISTTNNDTASFTVVRPRTQAATTWTQQTIDLTAYAGQSVYVAFHHQDYDMNYLFIDDISLYQGAYVPPAPDTLKVTFATADATMGTTDPAPGVYNYIDGDTIFFGSQANNGYIFQKWVIVLGNNAPQELGPQYANGYYIPASNWMSYDSVSFTAYFEPGVPDSVQVTYAVNNATMGTITPAAGTYNVVVGSAVTAQATPNTGYELTAWVLGIYNATGSLINTDTLLATDADFSNPVNYGTIPQSFADNNYTITVTALFDVQSTPQPVTEATIAASDIVYWVGSGNNQMVMAVNWANAAYAWGVRFNGSITVQNALDTIAAYDPRFNWTTGSYGLGDITFVEGNINLAGDTTSYWESKNNGITDAGLYQTLANNDFEKWAQPVAGVVTDSTYDSTYNYWWYTYTYPMTITPMWAPQVTPTNLTVTYATNDANLGTTNPAPGTYTYGASDTVFFNAIPTTGNSFVAWIIDYSDGTADTVGAQYQSGYYFLASSMMGDGITSMTFTAYFQAGVPTPDSVAVTYTVNDATMGSINPNGVVMTAVGDTVAAVATANAGFELYGWGYVETYNGSNIQDTIFETTVTAAAFLIVPQVYADNGVTITITAMFRQHEGINDVTANMNIYSTDNKIIVKGAEGEDIYIYDLNGRTVATKANANETMEFTMANSGVYMVKVGNAPAKRVLVIR